MWKIRKYCSKECLKEVNKKRYKFKKKRDSELILDEHKKDMVKINKIVNGNIVGLRSHPPNGYVPDIIKEEVEYEYELFGINSAKKFISKWNGKRFDNKLCKKRVLIIGISNELIKLFDSIFIYDKKLLEELKLKIS